MYENIRHSSLAMSSRSNGSRFHSHCWRDTKVSAKTCHFRLPSSNEYLVERKVVAQWLKLVWKAQCMFFMGRWDCTRVCSYTRQSNGQLNMDIRSRHSIKKCVLCWRIHLSTSTFTTLSQTSPLLISTKYRCSPPGFDWIALSFAFTSMQPSWTSQWPCPCEMNKVTLKCLKMTTF